MRITGGKIKGRKLKTRRGSLTRPLLSRVRKSLFDLIGDGIKGSTFLDLYAGSGAVGIEALSRGARKVVFVEKDTICIRIIRENLASCGLLSRAKIWQKDVLKFLPFLLKEERFDFIFVAPPYFKGLQNRTLDIIERDADEAVVIVQHSSKERVDFARGGVKIIRQRKYGDTVLTFLRTEHNDRGKAKTIAR